MYHITIRRIHYDDMNRGLHIRKDYYRCMICGTECPCETYASKIIKSNSKTKTLMKNKRKYGNRY